MTWSAFKKGDILSADLRSLSLMRICVGITLLVDLIIRLFSIKAHYTDEGILPLEGLFRFLWNNHYFSLLNISNSWPIQLFLFAAYFLCIVSLVLGYKTFLSTCLCLVFLISIHNRNPLIHQGGDDLLRLILFWGLFLPWNSYYALDSKRLKIGTAFYSLAIPGYLLQVAYVYIFSAILKDSNEWHGDYTALYYALSFDQIVLPAGKLLYPNEQLLKTMTFIVYYVEFFVPFLLIVPFFVPQLRLVFLLIITSLHIGIALTLNVGIFPLVAVVAMVGMIPSFVLDRLKGIGFLSRIKKAFALLQQKPEISKEIYGLNYIREGLALLVILFSLIWNVKTTGKVEKINDFHDLDGAAYTLRIDQHWGMFAPSVFKDDGWFVFHGEYRNGKHWDILNNQDTLSMKRPPVPVLFRSDRWRKYSENFLLIVNAHLRPYFCFYYLHWWNRNNVAEKDIRRLKMYYIKEVSLPDYKTSPPKKELLCTCQIE